MRYAGYGGYGECGGTPQHGRPSVSIDRRCVRSPAPGERTICKIARLTACACCWRFALQRKSMAAVSSLIRRVDSKGNAHSALRSAKPFLAQ